MGLRKKREVGGRVMALAAVCHSFFSLLNGRTFFFFLGMRCYEYKERGAIMIWYKYFFRRLGVPIGLFWIG